MSSFDPEFVRNLRLHPSIGWSLAQIAEARGLQEFWRRTKPEIILRLRESAMIQSAESSNRIEGVEVEAGRLHPLVMGSARPRDRSEEEIVGYRKALQWIHKNYNRVEINPECIRKLHQFAQGGLTGDAGEWKNRDNEIIEFSNKGDRRVRFKCTSARATPKAIATLCSRYADEMNQRSLPDLLLVANFILDFLCIHPFRDGNGRVSRLLTLLCLYQWNYDVGRYISLERIIETSKDEYYQALGHSSDGWHSSTQDLFPWWSFFLGHIKSGYQELKDRVDVDTEDSKSAMIRGFVNEISGLFSISDLLKLQPGLDREIVKKTLAKLKKEKIITLHGRGRGARWRRS